ncbi:hypothetical protein NXS19_010363 [Fusarium pseudograminearum]|nr:hypothetical protein NXS19_010363 [Fusarium pseudograminearum]
MTMFPPVEDSVLQNNPDFANLYNKLTNVVLNPDCSTQNGPRAKERASVRQELDRRRLVSAKQHLLTCAISSATPSSTPPATRASSRLQPPKGHQAGGSNSQQQQPSLPEPLLDLLIVLPPLLDANNPPLPQDTLQLLFAHPPFLNSRLYSRHWRRLLLRICVLGHWDLRELHILPRTLPSFTVTSPHYQLRYLAGVPTSLPPKQNSAPIVYALLPP